MPMSLSENKLMLTHCVTYNIYQYNLVFLEIFYSSIKTIPGKCLPWLKSIFCCRCFGDRRATYLRCFASSTSSMRWNARKKEREQKNTECDHHSSKSISHKSFPVISKLRLSYTKVKVSSKYFISIDRHWSRIAQI